MRKKHRMKRPAAGDPNAWVLQNRAGFGRIRTGDGVAVWERAARFRH